MSRRTHWRQARRIRRNQEAFDHGFPIALRINGVLLSHGQTGPNVLGAARAFIQTVRICAESYLQRDIRLLHAYARVPTELDRRLFVRGMN